MRKPLSATNSKVGKPSTASEHDLVYSYTESKERDLALEEVRKLEGEREQVKVLQTDNATIPQNGPHLFCEIAKRNLTIKT